MSDAAMDLVDRIEGMIDTHASYDAMGITRVCREAMSAAHDSGHALGVAQERAHADRLAEALLRIAERGCMRVESTSGHDEVFEAHAASVSEAATALAAHDARRQPATEGGSDANV